MKSKFDRTVIRATRSPLNKLRWSCDLSCGHSIWVTASRRPTVANCTFCANPERKPTAMIKWNVPKKEYAIIRKIAERAARELNADAQTVEMDLTACHMNGNPLKLQELLEAPAPDFGHDIFGINRHLDHETGELKKFFSPRCSKPESRKAKR